LRFTVASGRTLQLGAGARAILGSLAFSPSIVQRVDRSTGEALWVAESPAHQRIGVAFEWTFIREGVLVIANPMAIHTNALIFDDGHAISEARQVIYLSLALDRLSWQSKIVETLNG